MKKAIKNMVQCVNCKKKITYGWAKDHRCKWFIGARSVTPPYHIKGTCLKCQWIDLNRIAKKA